MKTSAGISCKQALTQWTLILLLGVILAGCTTRTVIVRRPVRGYEHLTPATPPPKYPDVSKLPQGSSMMIASWYGLDFHGKPTASGEIYDMYAYSAAHKTLPFGTRLNVTNPQTGISTLVVVNDRGPFVEGRDLDLSYGAAREIGLVGQGVGVVEVEYLGRDGRYVKYIKVSDKLAKGQYTVQIASFEDKQNALRLKKALDLQYEGVFIMEAGVNSKTFHRVRVGRYKDRASAIAIAQALAEEGYDTLVTDD
ncbi:MAG: septal ring lytic transglycosylase RlpA family protein [Candidatus Magnetobacterium sp. LHC-1]|uniref:Probable endolytic peptidoglycan transglycosylase RlpA n=1 Tax=Candidatus Magnetobacterium casense TaxID=1455061 RepID=A0ABS6S2D6_9BACT|nr:septal ring lytic transglycosylase RlpA family protein [Candidatus Magnetobacterium casensis]MBF0608446.1 septal ring lytic transglycosylase RlpA family protein [Nitrospirota bacterium]MBV6343017.1 septal ring lytic transglycosylase RlpA family protein [Candidatus Magnetobacterium casensis]